MRVSEAWYIKEIHYLALNTAKDFSFEGLHSIFPQVTVRQEKRFLILPIVKEIPMMKPHTELKKILKICMCRYFLIIEHLSVDFQPYMVKTSR